MATLVLQIGCIHVGTTADGTVAHVWPTPDPGFWHVSFSRGPLATFEPVLAVEVPRVLEEWDVQVESWAIWAAPAHETNLRDT